MSLACPGASSFCSFCFGPASLLQSCRRVGRAGGAVLAQELLGSPRSDTAGLCPSRVRVLPWPVSLLPSSLVVCGGEAAAVGPWRSALLGLPLGAPSATRCWARWRRVLALSPATSSAAGQELFSSQRRCPWTWPLGSGVPELLDS